MSAVGDVAIERPIHVCKLTLWRILLTQYACSSARAPRISYVIVLDIKYQRSKFQRYNTAVHDFKNIRLHV